MEQNQFIGFGKIGWSNKKIKMIKTLPDGREVKTYTEVEMSTIKARRIRDKLRKKELRKNHPRTRGSRGGRGYRGFGTYGGFEMEKEKLKPGHEPWPEQERNVMQLGINQLIQKRDKERQELMTEKAGLVDIHKEIQTNIDQAAMAVKAANMSLASLLFDQKYKITIHDHKNRVVELEHEIERKDHNIEVFQKQLDEGRPSRKKPKIKPDKKSVEKIKSKIKGGLGIPKAINEEETEKLDKEVEQDVGQSKEKEAGQEESRPDTEARS